MEKSKKSRALPYAATGLAGLTLGLAGVASVELPHNAARAGHVEAFAAEMARNRNVCAIDSVTLTSTLGKPALKVTITLGSGMSPADAKGAYDGVGTHTVFTDDTGNLVSGVLVGAIDAHDPSIGWLTLGSTPGDGPGSHTNSMTYAVPENSNDVGDYEVFRQNAVDADVTGPLVTDQHYHEFGRVQCGSFIYHQGGVPVVNP
jgi:hypothetical protein